MTASRPPPVTRTAMRIDSMCGSRCGGKPCGARLGARLRAAALFFRRHALCVAAAALALLQAACQQQHWPPYKGYKMSPYTVKGQRYAPMDIDSALRYDAVGLASWYEADGAAGAIGQRLHEGQLYAAHRTLPLPCKVRITSTRTGRSCVARVADRGPYIPGRLIDVSSAVAHKLGFRRAGLHPVRVEILSVGDGPYERKARR